MADYDPDRMNADDVDPDDLDQVSAWLDHPNTRALHDDLGRAFRAQPAAEQVAALSRTREDALTRHRQMLRVLADQQAHPADARFTLLTAAGEEVLAIEARIEALRGEE